MKQDFWKTISSEPHFANEHLEVVTELVQTPTQEKPLSWTIVYRKAAVIVAPMTRDGKIVMVRQERVPIREAIWEMPAGQIDHSDGRAAQPGRSGQESAREVALRELREEAGYELAADGELIPLGHYFSSPGLTNEYGYLFLARTVDRCAEGAAEEATESILDCRAFSVPEIRQMIADNEIRDANTLGMCARLAAHGYISLASG